MQNRPTIVVLIAACLSLPSCKFFKGQMSQTFDADASFIESTSRPAHELHEIAWSLCAREINEVDSQRKRFERGDGAFESWQRLLSRTRIIHRPLSCEDLLYVTSLIVRMHAPDPKIPNGYVIGERQIEEIYHELLSTTESGAPPPAHQHTHLSNFSATEKQAARQMVVDFFFEVVKARALMNRSSYSQVLNYLEDEKKVPQDWFRDPYYYTYVQYFGGPGTRNQLSPQQLERISNPTLPMDMQSDFLGDGTFETLGSMLPYLESLGTSNLYLLPHYESEGGDGGYDVLDYKPATRFGGSQAFEAFLERSRQKNFRIASDAVFNHTSYAHEWFRQYRLGNPEYSNHYLDITNWRDLGEVDDGSQGSRRYEVGGQIFNRVMIFPAISRTHSFGFKTPSGEEHRAYRHFYPFQVDLNFLEPKVLSSVWQIIGEELAQGQLAKRADAAIHWVKPEGTAGDGEPAAQAAIQLFRHYVSLVNKKAAVFPEAVNWVGKAHELFGDPLLIGPRLAKLRPVLGNIGIYSFQAQSTALREMMALRESSAWWDYWDKASQYPPPPNGDWINLISHHDEMMLGLTRDKSRSKLAQLIRAKKGITYKSDFSAAVRLSSLLTEDGASSPDPRRVAAAFVALFALPGTPQVYYGDELMTLNNTSQFQNAFALQKSYFQRMKNDPDVDFSMPSDNDIYDPRELLRGNIPKENFKMVNPRSNFSNVAPQDVVPRTIRVMSDLRKDSRLRSVFHSYQMIPLHTGGDGTVLGLVRSSKQNGKSLGVLLNLQAHAQHVWLSLDELMNFFRSREKSPGELNLNILARLVDIRHSGGTTLMMAHREELITLINQGIIDKSPLTLRGIAHQGFFRVRLEPYEAVVFDGGQP